MLSIRRHTAHYPARADSLLFYRIRGCGPQTATVEFSKFHTPAPVRTEPKSAPANALGIRHIMFAVDDSEDVLARLRAHGAERVSAVARYEEMNQLCFIRDPAGIISG